jgi:pimeloyl-ACP methyl ester carboxylesterase
MRISRDLSIDVRGARIAFRQWGEDHQYPVLAMHGWLDNAASFDALGPLLTNRRIIAIDLPGHGASSHREGGTYNIWDDLPALLALTRALGLERYALLGHSRGAFIAVMLAAIDCESVSSVVLLDGGVAPLFDEKDSVAQLRQFANDYGTRSAGNARVFETVEAAVQARVSATEIDPRAARALVPRSLEAVDGGFRWRTDTRLRYASAMKFGDRHVRHILAGVKAPGMLQLANGKNSERMLASGIFDAYAGLRVERVDGCHHCHMLDQAPHLAARILGFWSEYERGV